MSHENKTPPDPAEDRRGFPIELKLLLLVIILGVVAMALKATGIF